MSSQRGTSLDTRRSGDLKSSDPEVICGYFADFFKSVYLPCESSTQFGPFESRGEALTVSLDALLKSLRSVDTSKGSGPDDISPLLLKECSDL